MLKNQFRFPTRRFLSVWGVACSVMAGAILPATAEQASDDKKIIVIDGAKEGRTFEGLGGVSAGASSRLLIEYPEPQRSEILDFLFKPHYGASLQHLKVEVGGDVNSTDGCEPSHMHTRDDENYTRGYEWWLMEEAKKRNPNIILDCLPWGAPAWIGNGKYYSQDMADYLVKFVKGAKRVHHLDIRYVGTWNESNNMGIPYNPAWIKLLRRTFDAAGLRDVGIVAPDQVGSWGIVDEMNKDPEFKAAVAAVGIHYPHGTNTAVAKASGLPLWSSEDGPWRSEWGVTGPESSTLPQLLNENYIRSRITKTEIWSPITSYYDNLPDPGSGLMLANSPWSGNYTVQPAIWCVAHTTQFAQPGWKYLDSACQLLGTDGSVVALKSSKTNDYSVIIETMTAKRPQTLTFQLSGDLSNSHLSVWHSNAKDQFVRMDDITPEADKFSITVEPNSLYSLTTTRGQQKAMTTPPPAKPFPFPYHENFESYEVGKTPRYTIERNGIFEVVKRADHKGNALHLATLQKGIEWSSQMSDPQTFLGSLNWKDYTVSADFLLDIPGNVALYGRIGDIKQGTSPASGYSLRVADTGDWELLAAGKSIASGKSSFSKGAWHNLALKFLGDSITVLVDNVSVSEVKDSTFPAGMVGIGCGWHEAQFDNLIIQ
jgi:hypothetical protein